MPVKMDNYHYGMTLSERFWTKVKKSDGCWSWTGYHHKSGYTGIRIRTGVSGYGHRVAWELTNGPIPDGMEIDHLCKNPGCVNPAHMEVVTRAVNNARSNSASARAARRTHCPQGHEYAGENLMVISGKRVCRTCKNERRRKAA